MAAVHNWIKKMTEVEAAALVEYKLGNATFLHDVRVERDLLKAAKANWNPKLHIFRFNKCDACPTVEEFNKMLGLTLSRDLAVPPENGGSRSDFLRFTEYIHDNVVDKFVTQNGLHLENIANWFHKCTNEVVRGRAFCICVMGLLLLTKDERFCSLAVISILEQSRANKCFVPLILGETIDGLDDSEKPNYFPGSPRMLTIWLAEHLQRTGDYGRRDNLNNVIRTYTRREYQKPRHEINVWLQRLPSAEFRWYLVHWPVRLEYLNTQGHCIVQIMSLTNSTFYCPRLIMRQFGFQQNKPNLSGKFYGVRKLTAPIVSAIVRRWRNSTIQESFGPPSPNPTYSEDYRPWRKDFKSFESLEQGSP